MNMYRDDISMFPVGFRGLYAAQIVFIYLLLEEVLFFGGISSTCSLSRLILFVNLFVSCIVLLQ